jgi:hypothetical protein
MSIQSVEITPFQARQQEIAQYEQNVAMYQNILATLPSEWPEHLLPHRGTKNQHEVAGAIDDLQDVALLAQLWYADECRNAIRSEMVEMTKAKAIMAALDSPAAP